MLYCPAITAIYAPTLAGRASGVCIGQTNSLNVANFVRIADFVDVDGAYSMVDVWKSDGTGIFSNAMIWAHEMDIVLNGPLANTSGVVYCGHFPFGSLLSSNSETQSNFTLSQLVNNASKQFKLGQEPIQLVNAIVNNDLVFSMGMEMDELETNHSKFSNEYVAYAIIENAFRSIDSGASVQYTIDIHHSANYIANPKVGDSFAQSINHKTNVSRMDYGMWGDTRGGPKNYMVVGRGEPEA